MIWYQHSTGVMLAMSGSVTCTKICVMMLFPPQDRQGRWILGWMAWGTAESPTARWLRESVACLGMSWSGPASRQD